MSGSMPPLPPIEPMVWGSADRGAWMQQWEQEICSQDPEGCRDRPCVYAYLIQSVFQNCQAMRHPGSVGREFLQSQPIDCVPCAVWCDGQSQESQTTLLSVRSEWEQWWPCIVLLTKQCAIAPCYCPGLAWQCARPWKVHRDGLRHVFAPLEIFVAPVIHTPGPVIEEVDDDEETETETEAKPLTGTDGGSASVDLAEWEIIN